MDWQGNHCTGGPECHCNNCEPGARILTGRQVSMIVHPTFDIVYLPEKNRIDTYMKERKPEVRFPPPSGIKGGGR